MHDIPVSIHSIPTLSMPYTEVYHNIDYLSWYWYSWRTSAGIDWPTLPGLRATIPGQ